MISLAELANQYHTPLLQQFGHKMRGPHYRALQHIKQCHTPDMGELLYHCAHCQQTRTYYPSCGDRHCPSCQHQSNCQWLNAQQAKLLPVDYYMTTFTLPHCLNNWIATHQALAFNTLFKSAQQTLTDFFARDKQLGSNCGFTGVLHTHSRALEQHYHVHFVVPAGALTKQNNQWRVKTGKYLFNQANLAKVFRAKFLQLIADSGTVLNNTPKQWIAHCKRVGHGDAALTYLSRYLYRGVIAEKNILSCQGGNVTFQYRDSTTKHFKTLTEPAAQFLWRVLQHVLPKGFQRTRCYGFLHGNGKRLLQRLQLILKVTLPPITLKPRRPPWTKPCPCCDELMDVMLVKIGNRLLNLTTKRMDALGQ